MPMWQAAESSAVRTAGRLCLGGPEQSPQPFLPGLWMGCVGRALLAVGKQGVKLAALGEGHPGCSLRFSSHVFDSPSPACPVLSWSMSHPTLAPRAFPSSLQTRSGRIHASRAEELVKEPLRTPQGQPEQTASTNPRSFPGLKAIKCFIDKLKKGEYALNPLSDIVGHAWHILPLLWPCRG